MPQQHLLIIVTDLEIGGTPTVVREISKRLAAPDFRVSVASMKGDGPVAEQIREAGLDVLYLEAMRRRELMKVWHKLEAFGKVEGVTDVLSFLVHSNVAAALMKHSMPQLKLVQCVQTTQPFPKWHWLAQRWAAPAADLIVAPSQSVAKAAQQRSGIEPNRILVIPNGIDWDRWSGVPTREFDERDYRVGFVGRLDPVKHVPDLVRAAASMPGARVNVWGEGPERPVVERVIAECGVAETVTLHGPISDARDAYADSDIMVLCSEAEGFPLVLLEALATGRPVVATDAPGIRDVVDHEETALLVPVNDPTALATEVRRLAADATLRQKLSEAGRELVRQKYTWDGVAPKYRELFPPRQSNAEPATEPAAKETPPPADAD